MFHINKRRKQFITLVLTISISLIENIDSTKIWTFTTTCLSSIAERKQKNVMPSFHRTLFFHSTLTVYIWILNN